MLKGVIFDMDGVLIDSHPAHLHAWSRLMADLGREISTPDLAIILDGRKREDILKHFLGELSENDLRVFSKLKETYFAEVTHLVSPVPGVQRLLKALNAAGLKVGVATSGASARASEMLDRFELRCRVSTVVTGEDVENGKPDPAIFRLAANRLGLDARSAVVFEDAVSGIRAAKAAGMLSIGIASGSRSETLLDAGAAMVRPDFVGLELSEICSIVALSNDQSRRPAAACVAPIADRCSVARC